MTPKWQKQASLAQEICTLWFQFFGAVFASKGYPFNNIFYHRHSELIVKYNIGIKTLLQQGIFEPIFYGELVYKFKRIVGKPNFNDQFKKIIERYKKSCITWIS